MNDFDDYQADTRRTVVYDEGVALEYLLAGLGAEVGEILGKYAKHLRGDMDAAVFQEHMVRECGDVLWFVARLLDGFGVPLSIAAEYNLQKLQKRWLEGKIRGDGDDR